MKKNHFEAEDRRPLSESTGTQQRDENGVTLFWKELKKGEVIHLLHYFYVCEQDSCLYSSIFEASNLSIYKIPTG